MLQIELKWEKIHFFLSGVRLWLTNQFNHSHKINPRPRYDAKATFLFSKSSTPADSLFKNKIRLLWLLILPGGWDHAKILINHLNLFVMVENFPEITISYSNPTPMYERIKISCSSDVYQHMLEICEDVEYRESMYAIFLNRANHVLGYLLVSKGGISGTIVDVRIIMQAALRANSVSILICHNHPSGNTQPSREDLNITEKIKDAAKLFDISLLDHLIITSEKYLSMADEGLI